MSLKKFFALFVLLFLYFLNVILLIYVYFSHLYTYVLLQVSFLHFLILHLIYAHFLHLYMRICVRKILTKIREPLILFLKVTQLLVTSISSNLLITIN